MKYTKEQLEKIYSILIKFAGARTQVVTKDGETFDWEALDFVHTHLNQNTREYRFCGHLGFGGKYRIGSNSVDCYPEDMTTERRAIIEVTNKELKKITE